VAPRSVVRVRRADPNRIAELDDGSSLSCGAVVVATGVQYRALDAPGAADLVGRGMYYGSATSVAESLHVEDVVVVGGANSAGQASVYLARFARRVTILVRAGSLAERMSSYLVEQVASLANVEVRTRTRVIDATGREHLERVGVTGLEGDRELPATAMLVVIGARPRTEWLEGTVGRDEFGFFETGMDLVTSRRWSLERDTYLLDTSVPGVFAVGEARGRPSTHLATPRALRGHRGVPRVTNACRKHISLLPIERHVARRSLASSIARDRRVTACASLCFCAKSTLNSPHSIAVSSRNRRRA